MNTTPFTSGPGDEAVTITRVADRQWHASEGDLVVGRGHAHQRPDGRLFVSIDAWHDAAFDRLAEPMSAKLPRPLHMVVDEADVELMAGWRRAGFTVRRREGEYAVPTDPREDTVVAPSKYAVAATPDRGTLHRAGFVSARAEVQESNRAASALFEGFGAQPAGSKPELVR
jgi:hypothetical protein